MAEKISFDDFLKVDIRVGRITRAEEFPQARKPAFKLWIDFGDEIGERCSSAQITDFYKAEELVGRQIVAVVNFPEKQIATFKSQVLVLGAIDESNRVILLKPDLEVSNGLRIM